MAVAARRPHGPFDLGELAAWLEQHGGPAPHAGFEIFAKGMGEVEARSSWRS